MQRFEWSIITCPSRLRPLTPSPPPGLAGAYSDGKPVYMVARHHGNAAVEERCCRRPLKRTAECRNISIRLRKHTKHELSGKDGWINGRFTIADQISSVCWLLVGSRGPAAALMILCQQRFTSHRANYGRNSFTFAFWIGLGEFPVFRAIKTCRDVEQKDC